jgi:hypothetical protein
MSHIGMPGQLLSTVYYLRRLKGHSHGIVYDIIKVHFRLIIRSSNIFQFLKFYDFLKVKVLHKNCVL